MLATNPSESVFYFLIRPHKKNNVTGSYQRLRALQNQFICHRSVQPDYKPLVAKRTICTPPDLTTLANEFHA